MRDTLALDMEDRWAMNEYLASVAGCQLVKMLSPVLYPDRPGRVAMRYLRMDAHILVRWPRRPHWPRFRRRLCSYCPKYALLSEPRYMVCSGCGVARYCSEECQRAHWEQHQNFCRLCHVPPTVPLSRELKTANRTLAAIKAERGIEPDYLPLW